MKIKCCKCDKIAVWFYMPTRNIAKDSYCDDCVPRGCTCNLHPIDGNYDNQNESNWEEDRDEKGRLFPCCEYAYFEDGMEVNDNVNDYRLCEEGYDFDCDTARIESEKE